MRLEQICEMYGTKADYYDMNTGYTYHLTEMSEPDENGEQKVPVSQNGTLIGTCRVKLVRSDI